MKTRSTGVLIPVPLVCACLRLPHPPEESWLLGSALAMRQPDHHRSLREWANQLGGIYGLRNISWHVRPCCVLQNPHWAPRACQKAHVTLFTVY